MLEKVLDHFVGNVGLIALIVSAGLLILICNRDAFDVDIRPREELDPLGGKRVVWQWKYSSDFATHARLQLLHLVRVFRVVTTVLLVAAGFLFCTASAFMILGWLGFSEAARSWESDPWIKLIFDHGLGILLLGFGPIMIYQLARVVSDIVRARYKPGLNKPPGWTPY
jgi:hypothetical protein